MSYQVKQGNIFGRLGSGIGQGLAEQLPKEVERGRLAQGLQQFEQESANLTPIQQLARLSSIPGITPQMIQSFGELAKQQNIRNSFNRNNANEVPKVSPTQQFTDQASKIPFAGIDQRKTKQPEISRGTPLQQNQINSQNPTSPEFKTRPRWTPERKEQEIGDYWRRHPELQFNDVVREVESMEQRELSLPQTTQEEYKRLEQVRGDLLNSFHDKLAKKLQKPQPPEKGKISSELYKDITGENIAAVERAIDDELATNPNSNIEDLADKWSTKLLDLSKTKDQLKSLPRSSAFDFMNPKKQLTTLKKLENYAQIFKETGNSEEFFNILKSDAFEMSPQGAASIVYGLNDKIKKYIKESTPKGAVTKLKNFYNSAANSRKHAKEIENLMTNQDSLLSIAQFLSEQDTMFDENAFFDQLSKDKDRLGLSELQKRELAEYASGRLFPTWGDLSILTPFRGHRL